MERFICIHGHFYQPPRENPWLEAIEIQDSARPYHDWNERIAAECYAPNSASRILDGEGRIQDIISNYAKVSFNFGPTLLSWMKVCDPELYQAVLDADHQSMTWRSGHGAAIAQVYNHLIMPLATARDKRSQVIWGISDFEYRFKRFPEGMWLAETAVDLESLDILAEQGIKYTLLAPRQAAAFRKIGEEQWQECNGSIDPTRAYLCRLPSNRTITLFFYDGPISQAVAFEDLLNRGEAFANRLMGGFDDGRDWPQLFHIATDGETYGHHHKFGDMALAAALDYIESNSLARLTNYGEYLAQYPPTFEVQIHENSSWSCAHGVERWRANCGCNSGGHGGWNQEWRAPLRNALDWLRDRLAERYDELGRQYLKDPWQARNEYIRVVLDREEANRNSFLNEQARKNLSDDEKITVLKLQEIQRHAMLMYTSCGWFFDELSGIETVQVIQYAGRALQLAQGLLGQDLEKGFKDRLSATQSNIPENGNGARIYEKFVLPAQVDLTKVAVHFAFSSLFKEYSEQLRIFAYTVSIEDYRKMVTEEAALATGTVRITSEITLETTRLMFCVVRIGQHDFKGGINPCSIEAVCASIKEELLTEFDKGHYIEILGLMDKHFGMHNFSLLDLFRDEQREILNLILNATMEAFTQEYRTIYEHNRHLMEFVQETGMPVPKRFLAAAEISLNTEIKEALMAEDIDGDQVQRVITNMQRWQVPVDLPEVEYTLRTFADGLMDRLHENPSDLALLQRIKKFVELQKTTPIQVDLWDMQNVYYKLAKTAYPQFLSRAGEGDESAAGWIEAFRQLGEMLSMNLGTILPEG